jgi:hypothetical protein
MEEEKAVRRECVFPVRCVKRKGTRTQHRIPQPSLVPFLTKLKIAAAG